jgi:ATP/ADP translocase
MGAFGSGESAIYCTSFRAPAIALTAKIFEDSTDYSVENTARHALSLPVSREAEYKAKTAIGTLFCRAGDMTQAGVVWLGTTLFFPARNFAIANVAFIILSSGVTFMLSRTALYGRGGRRVDWITERIFTKRRVIASPRPRTGHL